MEPFMHVTRDLHSHLLAFQSSRVKSLWEESPWTQSKGSFVLICSRLAVNWAVLNTFKTASSFCHCRTMFWTAHSFQHISFIKTAGMDGSNKSTIFTGSDYPEGIAIDFKMSKIYWAATVTAKIQSSNLDGSDRRTIAQLSHEARPVGIALFGGTMFWGDSGNMKLESWSKVGNKLQTLHNDTNRIGHLAVASDLELPKTRINHCEGHKCSEVCVLTPTSFKCLNWETVLKYHASPFQKFLYLLLFKVFDSSEFIIKLGRSLDGSKF